MIQDIFKELDPYLKGLKIVENYNIVEIIFKNSWRYKEFLPESISFNQTKEHTNKNYYHGAFYSETMSFDDILETVKYIIEKNLEEEEKERLLKSKMEELKKVFQDTSLEDLKGLSFNYKANLPMPELNGVTEELQSNNESKK